MTVVKKYQGGAFYARDEPPGVASGVGRSSRVVKRDGTQPRFVWFNMTLTLVAPLLSFFFLLNPNQAHPTCASPRRVLIRLTPPSLLLLAHLVSSCVCYKSRTPITPSRKTTHTWTINKPRRTFRAPNEIMIRLFLNVQCHYSRKWWLEWYILLINYGHLSEKI